MRLADVRCRLSGHRPPTRSIWNDQRYFGRCPRCAAELCRPERGVWAGIPRGYRVVWRARTADDAPRWQGAFAIVWEGAGRGGVAMPLEASTRT